MNICVIGTGYVGLVTGACFAELGINVICMDTDEGKINKLKNGELPIYEEGLEQLIKNNYFVTRRLNFTTDIKEAVEHSEVIFITVNTPTLSDGNADINYVLQVAREIGKYINDYKVIVNKSTSPVGTSKMIKDEIADTLRKRNRYIDFDVISNPEFLREGVAVKDFIKPDRIVIGAESDRAVDVLKRVYNIQILFGIPIVITNIETSELIKYACNTFLSTKISFINEIANICEKCNGDIKAISNAMGLDKRIGKDFLNPGPGYGGSCFPKDTKAFISMAKTLGYVPKIVKSTIEVNEKQKKLVRKKINKHIKKLRNKTITILGLSFKSQTNDIRESPSIDLIKWLIDKNAIIKVYDPKGMDNAKAVISEDDVIYCDDYITACFNSECIIIMTPWEEFKDIDFNILKGIVKFPLLIDMHNCKNPEEARNNGFSYEGVGII